MDAYTPQQLEDLYEGFEVFLDKLEQDRKDEENSN